MPDYTKGKIYKIVKKDYPTLCYIGSTTKTLKCRLKNHINNFENRKNIKFCNVVDGKWDEWEMMLIENCSCSSKNELDKRR